MRSVVLGVGGLLGHDGNAALVVDGRIVAASQEERFSRKKHDAAFPRSAVLDCLSIGGLTPQEIDWCVFAEKPFQNLSFERTGRSAGSMATWLARLVPEGKFRYPNEARNLLPGAEFKYAWHHLSHAAAAFATSPFDRAAFLCVDGKGEDVSATVGVADERSTEVLFELPYENGLGLLYTLVTHFLGFPSFGSEYKVMGLAPYGEPVLVEELRRFTESDANGALRLRSPASFRWPDMCASVRALESHLGFGARQKGQTLEGFHLDLAASIQDLFGKEVLKMADFARRVTGEPNLLFCGGCAQNCVTAGELRRSGIFESVFNSPVGGDMGSGLGAALLFEQQRSGRLGKVNAQGFCLGSDPGDPPEESFPFEVSLEGVSLHEATAKLLAEGKIVGWVRGRMELGARALGARSILADPRVEDMQAVLNLKVKFRESFRPFAPAVLAEDCGAWFDSEAPSDYMQYTAFLRQEHRRPVPPELTGLRERLGFPRCDLPSIVHVDYSARIQTVRPEVHPDFHRLISEFKRLTGVPILINTSFNVGGQPIVRTAVEGWECFRHTDIDYLVAGDRIFRNPNDKSREEKLAWLRQFEEAS